MCNPADGLDQPFCGAAVSRSSWPNCHPRRAHHTPPQRRSQDPQCPNQRVPLHLPWPAPSVRTMGHPHTSLLAAQETKKHSQTHQSGRILALSVRQHLVSLVQARLPAGHPGRASVKRQPSWDTGGPPLYSRWHSGADGGLNHVNMFGNFEWPSTRQTLQRHSSETCALNRLATPQGLRLSFPQTPAGVATAALSWETCLGPSSAR